MSNYVLADSSTSEQGVLTHIIKRELARKSVKVIFKAAQPNGSFGEHDVDTAIHTLFSRQMGVNIFESMCNPPGGDWSGISYWDFSDRTEYRWTSLPRVSSAKAKRPDHIIQIYNKKENIFLVIESKHHAKDLEKDIGNRLTKYVQDLFKIAPTACREAKKDWKLFAEQKSPIPTPVAIAGGAFCGNSLDEMKASMKKGKLDFIFAFEFKSDGTAVGHILLSNKSQFLSALLMIISSQFKGGFEIKIY